MPLTVDPDGIELATIEELVDLRGRHVLEVGCGDGRLTFRYAAKTASVLGIDPDREAISTARRERPALLGRRVRFRVAKRVAAPRRRKFDIALYSWSL
jgi:2-polyprenyl-3-methyl-5-hydroxy-6-metoxy-1,4-benzoquinol methylase